MNYNSPDQKQAQGRIFNMLMGERYGGAGILRHGLATGDPRAIMAGMRLRQQELAGSNDERRISAQSQAAQQLAKMDAVRQFGLLGMKQKGDSSENALDRDLKYQLGEISARDQMAQFAARLMSQVGMEQMRGNNRAALADTDYRRKRTLAQEDRDFRRGLEADKIKARSALAQQAAPARTASRQAGVDARALSALAGLDPEQRKLVDPSGALMDAVRRRLMQGIPIGDLEHEGYEDDDGGY